MFTRQSTSATKSIDRMDPWGMFKFLILPTNCIIPQSQFSIHCSSVFRELLDKYMFTIDFIIVIIYMHMDTRSYSLNFIAIERVYADIHDIILLQLTGSVKRHHRVSINKYETFSYK